MNNLKLLKIIIWSILALVIILVLALGSSPKNNSSELTLNQDEDQIQVDSEKTDKKEAKEKKKRERKERQEKELAKKTKKPSKKRKKNNNESNSNNNEDTEVATVKESIDNLKNEDASQDNSKPLAYKEGDYNYRFDSLSWEIKEQDGMTFISFRLDNFTRLEDPIFLARPFATYIGVEGECNEMSEAYNTSDITLGALECNDDEKTEIFAVQLKSDPNTIRIIKRTTEGESITRELKMNEIVK